MANFFKVKNRNTRLCSSVFFFQLWIYLVHCSTDFSDSDYVITGWNTFFALIWIYLHVSESDLGAISHLRKCYLSQRVPPSILYRGWIEYCNIVHTNSKRCGGDHLPWWSEEICKGSSPRCPKNTFPKVFCSKFLHSIPNELNGVNINLLTHKDCGSVTNFSVVYLAKTHNHLVSSNRTWLEN